MFHANGWTFTWIVTAAGAAHVCLRKIDPRRVFQLMADESITMLCAAPTVLISLANAPAGGAPPRALAAAPRRHRRARRRRPSTIQRLEGELGLDRHAGVRAHRTAPFITVCEPRPEHAGSVRRKQAPLSKRVRASSSSHRASSVSSTTGRHEVPRDGQTLGEIVVRGNVVMEGYYKRPGGDRARPSRHGWFHTGDAAVVHADGYAEIRDRFKDVIISGGENISSVEVEGDADAPPRGAGGRRRRRRHTRDGARCRRLSSC